VRHGCACEDNIKVDLGTEGYKDVELIYVAKAGTSGMFL
jgi:hypothetical protein